MSKKRLLIIIAVLILVPLFWVTLEERKVQVQPVEAAPDEISRWSYQMKGSVSRNTHSCDGVFYDDGDQLITWGDERTGWAEGRFTNLDPSVTYHGYIEALSDIWTGSPADLGKIEIERSDGGGWREIRPQFSSQGWGRYSYGTFSGVTSMSLRVMGRCADCPPGLPCDQGGNMCGCPQSDSWVRRVYLEYTPTICGEWGPTISPTCQQQEGLWGRYYRDNPVGGNRFDGGIKLARYERVRFNWGAQSPNLNKLECDHFSARWTGYVNLSSTGKWQFETRSDDGVRLWLDDDGNGNFSGDRIINDWSNGLSTETSDRLSLDAGWYKIKLDYYENTGNALIRLRYRYKPPGGVWGSWQVIPKNRFRSCNAPVSLGPDLTCEFTEISSGAIVGSGTAADPYKIQRGTESIKIKTTADPDPGGGTMDFSVDGNTIKNDVSYGAGGIWQLTWDGPPPPTEPDPAALVEGGHSVKAHFDGYSTWGASDGYCYFDIVTPANAEYLISARGSITSGTRSFCWGQDSGCLLPYYPEGNISGVNTEIDAPTYDELLDRFGGGATSFSGSLPTGSGKWRTTGSITVSNQLAFPANRKILIFIDGTLTIDARITIPQSSVVVFVVGGKIRFRKNLTGVDEVGGLYIAEGNIETAYNYGGAEVTPRLIVYGSLISTKGTVVLKRRLSDANSARYASEQIRFEPKYYVLIAQYLGEAQVSWKEVAP